MYVDILMYIYTIHTLDILYELFYEIDYYNVTGHFGYANDIISYRSDIIFIHFVNVQQLYYQFTYIRIHKMETNVFSQNF